MKWYIYLPLVLFTAMDKKRLLTEKELQELAEGMSFDSDCSDDSYELSESETSDESDIDDQSCYEESEIDEETLE